MKTMEEVLDVLQQHCKEHSNEALCHHAFSCCKQAEGRSFDTFHLCLKSLAEEVDL